MSLAVNWMRGLRRLWLVLSTCWCLFIATELWGQVARPRQELSMADLEALMAYG